MSLKYSQREFVYKGFGILDVTKNVVQWLHYIRVRGLSHWQFKVFQEYQDSDYPIVVYFFAVRWISRVATLNRPRNKWQEIKLFMESKHQNVTLLSDENWLNDLAFLTDITQHLSELNLILQGKCQLVNKLFEHICAFGKKNRTVTGSVW